MFNIRIVPVYKMLLEDYVFSKYTKQAKSATSFQYLAQYM